MASAIYWDTSVLLKLYAEEPDSEHYRGILCLRTEQVAISFLHRVELLYALAAKEQRGEIAVGQAETLYASFRKHRGEGRFLEIPWGEDVENAAHEALTTCKNHEPPVPLRSLDGVPPRSHPGGGHPNDHHHRSPFSRGRGMPWSRPVLTSSTH